MGLAPRSLMTPITWKSTLFTTMCFPNGDSF
jgi:hypothetical protein